jgi:hypothetical protein
VRGRKFFLFSKCWLCTTHTESEWHWQKEYKENLV